MILLDTDHLSLLQARDAPVAFALQARLEAFPPDEVVTTVITIMPWCCPAICAIFSRSLVWTWKTGGSKPFPPQRPQ
jgi:hypothetical protein